MIQIRPIHALLMLLVASLFATTPARADDPPPPKDSIATVEVRTQPLSTVADSVDRIRREAFAPVVEPLCKKLDSAKRFKKLDDAIRRVTDVGPLPTARSVAVVRDLRALLSDSVAAKLPALPTEGELATTDEAGRKQVEKRFAEAREAALNAATNERAKEENSVRDTLRKAISGGNPSAEDLERATNMCITPQGARGLEAFGSDAVSGLGWQTAVLQGLTSFLEGRASAEITLWFYESFGDAICKDQGLLPETCLILKGASARPGSFSLTLLSAAIESDLVALPLRLLPPDFVAADSAGLGALRDVFARIRRGDPPLMLFAGLGTNAPLKEACAKQANSSSLSCVLVTFGTITSMLGDVVRQKSTISGDFERRIDKVIADLRTAREELCKSPTSPCFLPESATTEQLRTFLRAVHHLENVVETSRDANSSRLQAASDVLYAVIEVLDTGFALYGDAALARWNKCKPAVEAMAAALRGAYPDAVRQIVVFTAKNKTAVPKYMPVLADLATAKTAADVKSALDAAAAPVGSYRSKQERFTVSATALLGIAGGGEFLLKGEGRNPSKTGGVIAAVGLDISGPIGDGPTNWGIFISAIDVGQLVTVPINPQAATTDDGTKRSTAKSGGEIDIVQVLSPGAYLRLGIPKSPFTVGAGAAFAPALRHYEDANPVTGASMGTDRFSVIRVNLFLAVDLTLLPL